MTVALSQFLARMRTTYWYGLVQGAGRHRWRWQWWNHTAVSFGLLPTTSLSQTVVQLEVYNRAWRLSGAWHSPAWHGAHAWSSRHHNCSYSLLKCSTRLWAKLILGIVWTSLPKTYLWKMVIAAILLATAKMVHQWKQLASPLRWLSWTIQAQLVRAVLLCWIVTHLPLWWYSICALTNKAFLRSECGASHTS